MSNTSAPTPRLAALRYRDFRLIWLGEMISTIGSQMQFAAINWHVYELLRGQTYTLSILGQQIILGQDALALGVLGLVRILPIFVFALLGGLMADAQDRRRVMIWAHAAATLFAVILAAITLAGNENIAAIYLLTALGAAATAFENPARQSIVPNLVPREHLANAVSLNTLMWQAGTIVGPALTGVLIAQFNIGLVYAINAATFVIAIVALLLMRYRGQAVVAQNGLSLNAIMEGLRFTFGTPIIRGTMLLDFFATFFSSARTMLPLVVGEVLHLGPEWYGLLSTAQSVGSVVAGIIVALRKDIYRQGMVLLVSVTVYGVATALFGLATNFALSYFLFALTGAGDTVSTVIRGTIRQLMTPDHLRGRMVGVNMMFFMGGPQLGELEAGLVASAFGTPFAIFTGGVATVLLTAYIAWKYPRLRNYTSATAQAESQKVLAANPAS